MTAQGSGYGGRESNREARRSMTWAMQDLLIRVAMIALASCGLPTKRNPGTCCTTVEDCAALGVEGPKGWECASGQVCIRNECVATECQASSDCPAESPVCSPDQVCVGCVDSSQCTQGVCETGTQTCVECLDSKDCDGRLCDLATHSCSGCKDNTECASGVCIEETGACAAPSSVVYASPTGADAGDCQQSAPCSLKTAIRVATGNAARPFVLMAPGGYSADVQVIAGNPIWIFGNSATLIGAGERIVFKVSDGAEVTVSDLTIKTLFDPASPIAPLGCSTSIGPRTKLSLFRVNASSLPAQGFFGTAPISSCELTLHQVVLQQLGLDLSGSVLKVDQSQLLTIGDFVGSALRLSPNGLASVITMTNSVVRGAFLIEGSHTANVDFSTIVGCPGASQATFGCNRAIVCGNAGFAQLAFHNNVVAAQQLANSVDCTGFSATQLAMMFSKNITFPQTTPIAGNLVVDPRIMDLTADFRLRSGSPAIDAADVVTTDHDYTGHVRPVGPKADLGAFEFVP